MKAVTMKAIEKVLDNLQAHPLKEVTQLGAGFGNVRIPGGTTFGTSQIILYYILNDLAIDCHLSDEERKNLNEIMD